MKFHAYSLLVLIVMFPLSVIAQSEREILEKEINALSSDLSCEIDTDCKTVGIGSRPCGGFNYFIIYSTKSVNANKMEGLSAKYYELDEQYNLDNKFGSICSMAMPKVAACILSKCVNLGSENNAITPLHWAVQNKNIELINSFVSQGVNINTKAGFLGDTPLQHAIRMKLPLEIIKLLVDLGANVNASKFPLEKSMNTPLHLAVSTKRYDLVKYLVEHGADKRAGGESSPYRYADYHFKDHTKYNEIKELLRPNLANE